VAERAHDLPTLVGAMMQLIVEADQLEEVREAIAHGVRMISPFHALSLREVGISRAMEVTVRRGAPPDSMMKAIERHLCRQATVIERTATTLDRFGSEQGRALVDAYVDRYGLCIARPLHAYGEQLGILTVHYDDRLALAEAEFDAIRRLSKCAAVALHNGRMRQELRDFAHVDPLTGLASRRRLDLELARRAHTGLSLLLIDFDGLKAVNDTLGYERGDELIGTIGGVLAASAREGEFAARLGGDEFVLILADADERQARMRCEELTIILDGIEPPQDLRMLFHGASVGSATAEFGDDPRDVLLRASAEMRARKRRRRSDRDVTGRDDRRLGSV
jgi:diguanylate cyclase (GGDEF)-like protein